MITPVERLSDRAVDAALTVLPSVGLAEVLRRAELQHRIDRKYIVPTGTFTRWMQRLGDSLQVLQIDQRRSFRYESIYFDTADLLTFRQHRQDRRRRYKIRTRTYLDSDDCTFEVKLEGRRGATIKDRMPYPIGCRDRLTGAAVQRLSDVLVDHDLAMPSELRPVQRVSYRRSTLLLRDAPVRITCDAGLRYDSPTGRASGPRDHLIIEVKSATERNAATAALAALRVQPAQISKYCVGVGLLTGLSANRWQPVLRRYFSRSSAPGEPLTDTSPGWC